MSGDVSSLGHAQELAYNRDRYIQSSFKDDDTVANPVALLPYVNMVPCQMFTV